MNLLSYTFIVRLYFFCKIVLFYFLLSFGFIWCDLNGARVMKWHCFNSPFVLTPSEAGEPSPCFTSIDAQEPSPCSTPNDAREPSPCSTREHAPCLTCVFAALFTVLTWSVSFVLFEKSVKIAMLIPNEFCNIGDFHICFCEKLFCLF